MKLLVIMLTALFSIGATAHGGLAKKYVCQEYNFTTDEILQHTVVLRPTSEARDWIDEDGDHIGYQIDYALAIYEGASIEGSLYAKGTVSTADVHFQFESEDKKVSLMIYLDEPEQSHMTVKDGDLKIKGSFICR